MKSEICPQEKNIGQKRRPGFLDICFFALIFLLFFQFALNLGEDIDLASGRVLVPAFFLVWFAGGLAFQKPFPRSFLGEVFSFQGFGLLVFLAMNLVSLFGAQEISWGLRKLLFFASMFPLFFFASAFLKDGFRFRAVLKILPALGLAAALAGALQFLAQFVFGHGAVASFYLEKAGPFLWGNNLSQMVSEYPSWFVALGRDLMRAFGYFPDPHMLSFFLGLVLPLILAGALAAKKKQFWLFLLAGFLFLVLLLTFSRGGYLGILAAFISMAALGWRFFSGKTKLKIVLAGILTLFFIVSFASPVLERFFSSFFLSEGSSLGRMQIWKHSWEVFSGSPVIGVGLGNYPRFADPLASYRTPITSHNLYLDLLAETGILGFGAWFLLLAGSFWQLFGRRRSFLAIGFFGSLVYFSVHSFFESAVFNPIILSFFLLILALAKNLRNYEHSA